MIRSNLCEYSDAYILVKETMSNPNTTTTGAAANNTNKKVIVENCAGITYRICEAKKNIQVDNAPKN